MTFRQFLALMRARWWVFLFVASAVVVAMLAFTMTQPRIYTGTAQVIIETKDQNGNPVQVPDGYLATQMQLIGSERVSLRALDVLKYDEDPAYAGRFGTLNVERDTLRRAIAAALVRDLRLSPVRESSAITIASSGQEQDRVADIANAFMQAYIDVARERRTESAEKGGSLVETEVEKLRADVEEATARLADAERKRNLTSSDADRTLENQRMTQMSNELLRVEAQRAEAQRVVERARASMASNGAESPEVMRNPLVGQLQNEQRRLEQRIADEGRKLGPEHPNMQAIRNELQTVQRRLRNAVASSIASIVKDYEAIRRREADLRIGLDRARSKVVDVKRSADEIAELKRDLQTKRTEFENMSRKLTQARIDQKVIDANIVPITPATRPTLPSSPDFARNGMIGVVLGVLLGMGTVIGLEASRPKVRMPEDLERVVRAPVVGVLSRLPAPVLSGAVPIGYASRDARKRLGRSGASGRLGYSGPGGGSGGGGASRGGSSRGGGSRGGSSRSGSSQGSSHGSSHGSSRGGSQGSSRSRSGEGGARGHSPREGGFDEAREHDAGAGAGNPFGPRRTSGGSWRDADDTPAPAAGRGGAWTAGHGAGATVNPGAAPGAGEGGAAPGAGTELSATPRADTGHPVLDALIDAGLMNPADVEKVEQTAEREGLRIGDAAVASGAVTAKQYRHALARTNDYPLLDEGSPVAREVFAAFDTNHPFLDELRRLRSQLKARWFGGAERRDRPGRTLAVLSEGPDEGKTFTAANLAVSFAQMGDLTLLIDGDMWGGRLHEMFALDNDSGLTTLLSRRCNPRDVFREVPGLDGLTVIPAGPEVPNASDLLARHTFEMLLDLFERAFDVVIIDTPSGYGKPDAALIAAKAGGYVVVARENKTLSKAMASLVDELEPMGSRLVGTVLVRA